MNWNFGKLLLSLMFWNHEPLDILRRVGNRQFVFAFVEILGIPIANIGRRIAKRCKRRCSGDGNNI